MNLFSSLLELLFPSRCTICRNRLTEDAWLICAECRKTVIDVHSCCICCGYPLPAGGSMACPMCARKTFSFHRACAVSLYRGRMKTAVFRYKYGGHTELARSFGRLMAEQIQKCGWPDFDAVVPIPLHPQKRKQRGFDQALLLAQEVGRQLNVPVKTYLSRQTDTVSQTTLTAAGRWKNMQNVFCIARGVQIPESILLIDDLLTTGATAHFAAQTLKQGGAREIHLAVIGRS